MTIAITGSTSNLGVYLVKFLKSKKKKNYRNKSKK